MSDEGSEGAVAGDPASIRKAVQHDKDVADLYWGQGNWEGAYLRYRDALKLNPHDADALYRLAEAEGKLGRNVNARQHYLDFITVAPDDRRAKAARKEMMRLPDKDTVHPQNPFAPGPALP